MEMMPPDTNRGPSFAGREIRLGRRKPAAPTCREEVLSALAALETRAAGEVFTVREVYAEMVATGTRYAEPTVFKTMQRMKEPPARKSRSCWNPRRSRMSLPVLPSAADCGSPCSPDRVGITRRTGLSGSSRRRCSRSATANLPA